MGPQVRESTVRTIGRYAIAGEIASGGMATVHLGRVLGAAGFERTVAIKRMHADLAKDPEFVSMFVDEARLAARVHHPNVVSTLDVVAATGELFVVMEYIHGESLAWLMRVVKARETRIPIRIGLRIACDLLAGLHAAHEAQSDGGEPLGLVHRDVSPQNVLVGVDGVSRIIDFGVAKAAGRIQTTREGQIKGKIAYMSPEQLLGQKVDRRSDVYSASVVLWEMLTGTRLFHGENQGHVMQRVLASDVSPPSRHVEEVPAQLDSIVLRGLSHHIEERFATAHAMALALEAATPQATTHEVSGWIETVADERLSTRAQELSEIDAESQAPTAIVGMRSSHASVTRSDVAAEVPRLFVRAADSFAVVAVVPAGSTPAAVTADGVSASVPSELPFSRPSRTPAVAWAIRGGAILATLGGLSVGVRAFVHRIEPAPASLPLGVTAPASAAPTVTETPAAEISANALPAPTASRSADAPAVSAAETTPPPTTSPPKLKPKTSSPARAASPNCHPPFVVDSRGVRTYKRECVTGRP